LLQVIGKIKDKQQLKVLIQLGCIIGKSDGDFDKSEKAVVKDVCNFVEVSPAEFEDIQ